MITLDRFIILIISKAKCCQTILKSDLSAIQSLRKNIALGNRFIVIINVTTAVQLARANQYVADKQNKKTAIPHNQFFNL
jgi:hypothetical protein